MVIFTLTILDKISLTNFYTHKSKILQTTIADIKTRFTFGGQLLKGLGLSLQHIVYVYIRKKMQGQFEIDNNAKCLFSCFKFICHTTL